MTALPKIIYHGSNILLVAGDSLRAKECFDSDMKSKITAVFATPNLEYAKKFALPGLVGANGMTWINNNKIIFQNFADPKTWKRKFYVYELDADGFQLDARNEYFFPGDKEILKVNEYDLISEIKSMGLDIYLFDEFDAERDGKLSHGERTKIFDDAMENKKYIRIDVEKMLTNNEEN